VAGAAGSVRAVAAGAVVAGGPRAEERVANGDGGRLVPAAGGTAIYLPEPWTIS